MNNIFLLTGGNIGNRRENLESAAALIQVHVGKIINRSRVYETEPWGFSEQPSFYNQVLQVHTKLLPEKVLKTILQIEEEMGRVRTVKNAARIIDIDILFFNNITTNEEKITIPHPEIANRRFVLTPLDELAPEMIHPILKKTIHELLIVCKDELKVIPID